MGSLSHTHTLSLSLSYPIFYLSMIFSWSIYPKRKARFAHRHSKGTVEEGDDGWAMMEKGRKREAAQPLAVRFAKY